MTRIFYWQRDMRMVPADPSPECLPQDEATAAVVIAAVLARNINDGHWPGEYWASIDDGSNAPVTVAEDDPRVAIARAALFDMLGDSRDPRRRDFTAWELEQAREAVLATAAG